MLKACAIALAVACFSASAAQANDWRVDRLMRLDTAIAKNAAARKAQCELQSDKKIQDVCNRFWDLIDARVMRLRPALEFMIAVDKISGHNALKSVLTGAMSTEEYAKEVNEIGLQMDIGMKVFTIDQSKIASK